MNLWVDFDLKFDPILQGKMAKISPNIHKIEIYLKDGTFGKSDRFWTTKKGTSSGPIKILRPLL